MLKEHNDAQARKSVVVTKEQRVNEANPVDILYGVIYLLDRVEELVADATLKQRVKNANLELEKIFDLLEAGASREN